MDYKLIRCEEIYDVAVCKITLNSPKANILEAAMLREISCALAGFEQNKKLKLILFTGEGKHFSFGASVQEHTKENAAMMLRAFHDVFYRLVELSIPTMAVVKGQCLGGGMELAIFCNIIVADQSAVFGQPEIVLGVFPPPASVILPRKVGQAHADAIVLSGQSIDASEAYRIGLVNFLSGEGQDCEDLAKEWIEKNLLSKSATSLRLANKAVRRAFNRRILEDLPAMEALYLKELMECHDPNEGISAFIERRKPDWKNE